MNQQPDVEVPVEAERAAQEAVKAEWFESATRHGGDEDAVAGDLACAALTAALPALRAAIEGEQRATLEAASTKDVLFQEAVKHLSFESPEHQEEFVWQMVDDIVSTVLAALASDTQPAATGGENG